MIFNFFLFDSTGQRITLNLENLMQQKRNAVSTLTKGIVTLFEKNNVSLPKLNFVVVMD